MTWRTHLLGGVGSLWLLRPLETAGSDLSNLGLLAGLAGLGALLPDLDAQESKVKHLAIAKGVEPFALPSLVLHRLLGHRGLMHSLLGWGIAAVVVGLPVTWYVGWQPALALLLGYGSHLLLDACTKHGIPFLYPNKRRLHALPKLLWISTGSQAEDVVFALLALAVMPLLLFSSELFTSGL